MLRNGIAVERNEPMPARYYVPGLLFGASALMAATTIALLPHCDTGRCSASLSGAGTSAGTAPAVVVPHAVVGPSSPGLLVAIQSSRVLGYGSVVERSLRPFGPLHDLIWPSRLPIYT